MFRLQRGLAFECGSYPTRQVQLLVEQNPRVGWHEDEDIDLGASVTGFG